MGLLDKIKRVRDVAQQTGTNILLYGDAGTGKTSMMNTIPEEDQHKTLILSAESGLMSIRHSEMACEPIRDYPHFQSLLQKIREDDGKSIRWLCIDSISEISEMCLDYHLGMTKDPRRAYGNLAKDIVQDLKLLRDLPVHTVSICKAKHTEDQRIIPSCPGSKIVEELPFIFDVVGLCRTETNENNEVVHFVQFRKEDNNNAKDRTGSLQDFMKPDLAFIINTIKGEQKK